MLTVLGFGLGWWSKPTPVPQVPASEVTHDTTEVRDTLFLPYIPKPTTGLVADDTTPEDTTHESPSLKTVVLDPKVGDAQVYILYNLPSKMYPLGIVTRASVTYPRVSDSIFVKVPYEVEVYRTDLGMLSVVILITAILSFAIGVLV
jgi:hypothetical protein